MEANKNDENTLETKPTSDQPEQPLSKSAQKKLKKLERYQLKKAQKKASEKEHKLQEASRKILEWQEKLSSCENDDEKRKLIDSRMALRQARIQERALEKEKKNAKLNKARESGQNIVIDLDFGHLMTEPERHSLTQQIMYCYAVNVRCETPAHLWLTGCQGEMLAQLLRLPGYENWIIEKETRPYIETFEDKKENLVYLTADSETILEEFDLKKIYIVGGLVDRNRWKGITMNKAKEQGIETARLPIENFMKMSSSKVLTVNQVVEIILKFLETKDWKASFFAVIPQRKRDKGNSESSHGEIEAKNNEEESESEVKDNEEESKVDAKNNGEERVGKEAKRQCIET